MNFLSEDTQEVVLQVPGRICLFGDKIDLVGLPVIAAAINSMMTIRLKKGKNNHVNLYSETFQSGLSYELGEKGDWTHPLKYWCAIIFRLKDKIGGFEAVVSSDIPVGAGLSSSAAISVGLILGLNKLFNLGLSSMEIAELAYVAEHDDLGISCGRMDQYSIAHGGVNYIETGDIPVVHPLEITDLPIVVGDSQEERHAKKVLNKTMKLLNENDPTFYEAFRTVHNCLIEGKTALLEKNYQKVGECMKIHQLQENIMAAATPKLNLLCQEAIKAGALGAKQMGAGGGGCMVAVCPGKQKQVAAAINAAGGKAWVFNIFKYGEK
jgi:mevalonate kinase